MNYDLMSKEELIREIAALAGKISELKYQHERLVRDYIEEAPDAIFISDEKDNLISVNSRGCALLGYSREELLRMNVMDLVDKKEVEANPLRLEDIRAGKTVMLERSLRRKDGSVILAEVSARAVNATHLQAIVRDISEKKRLTEELMRSEERFRKLSETSFEAMVIHQNGVIIELNNACCALFGSTREDLIGRNILDFTAEEYKETVIAQFSSGNEGLVQAVAKKKDGTLFPCEVIGRNIYYKQSAARIISIRDTSREREVETILRRNEERYRALMEGIPGGIVVYNHEKIFYVNKQAFRKLGMEGKTLADFKTPSIFDWILPEFHDVVKERIAGLLKGEDFPFMEIRLRTYDGRIIDVETKSKLIELDGQQAIHTIFHDITERKKIERSLSESQERLALVLNNTDEVVYYLDFALRDDGRPTVLFVSQQIEKILGMTAEEYKKAAAEKDLMAHVHPDDVEAIRKVSKEITSEKRPGTYNYRFRHVRTGRYIWIEERVFPQYDKTGRHIANFGITRDVTELKEAEIHLKQSELSFRTLAENALDVVYRYSLVPVPHYEYVSPSAETITGYSQEEFYKDPYLGFKLIHPDDRGVTGDSEKILRGGGSAKAVANAQIVMRWVRKDGKIIWTETRNKPIVDSTGKIVAVEGISRDITERKNAEEDLLRSEEKFRLLSLSAPVGIFLTDSKGTPYYVNKKLEEITGLPHDRIVRNNWLRLVHPEDSERVSKKLKNSVEKGLDFNDVFRVRNFALGTRWVKFNAIAIRPSSGASKPTGWVGTIEDITEQREREARIRESERALSTLMSNLPGMAYRCDYDEKWTMRFVSQGCEELTGYKAEDLRANYKLAFSDIVLPEDRLVGREDIRRAIETKKPFEIEYRIVAANGSIKWVWEKGEGVFNDKGELLFLEGFITDITDRKQYEAQINQSRESYKALIDTSPIGVFIHDEKGKILFINAEGVKIMGSDSMEEFIGTNMLQYVLEEHHGLVRERKKQLERGEKDLPFITTKMKRKDGRIIDVETKAARIIYEGRPAIQIVCQDITLQRQVETERLRAQIAEETNKKLQQEITERKNAERILNETQKYTRLLIDSSLDMICATDKEGHLTEFNTAAQKTFGYTLDEVLGKHVSVLYANPKERIKITDNFLYKEGTFAGEVVNKKKNGETFTAYLSASVLKNETGEIIGAMGVSRDISEIKKAEEELRMSEERYRDLFENATDLIQSIDTQGNIIYVNDSWRKTMGYTKREIASMNIFDVIHPEYKRHCLEMMKGMSSGMIEKIDKLELAFVTKKKKTILAEGNVTLKRMNGQPYATRGIFRNITERKLAEEKIHDSEQKLQAQAAKMNAIIENSSHVIWTVNRDMQLTAFNRNYLKLTKSLYDVTSRIGQAINRGRLRSDEQYNEFWDSKYKETFRGNPQHFETSLTDKNGNTSWREIYLNPIYDDKGRINEVSGIAHDITEKKLAEEKIKQSLKEKEVLLKEVHHRVKNNLQVISSILNLQSSYVKDKNTLAMLKESQNRIKSMAFIHESLYQTKDFSRINFSEYVSNLTQNLVHSYEVMEGKIELDLDIDPIFLNLDQSIPCGLIINELISNSLKYAFRGRKRGKITVRIKSRGERISMLISDNGVGLPKKVDFRNTDSLGLQLVVTLTEQIGGAIKLDRKKGTKFAISFKQRQTKPRI
ncbi:MAG: PAS domain S-box protein [Bacteroidota bacterium]